MQDSADASAGDAPSRSRWLGELLDCHGSALALYAAQWTSAADDCLQEALVKLAAEDPPPERPVAWLYTVVRRLAVNHSRSERRRHQREQSAWQQRLEARPAQGDQRELLDAVASLPAELRELVVLKTWGGLTFEEMAEVLRVPSSTLHRKYREALDRLRMLWEVPCPGTTRSE
ncbi:RNA polymerase sigma factor [Aeoliella sp.]|uniref:RNA polymerase sigma factor n=1 Tax=Aeoliella sp. TaxID=2795800 RepID=UPI003CCBD54A